MDKLADCKEKTLAFTQPGRDQRRSQNASPLLPNRMSEPCACPSSPQLTLANLRQLSGGGDAAKPLPLAHYGTCGELRRAMRIPAKERTSASGEGSQGAGLGTVDIRSESDT